MPDIDADYAVSDAASYKVSLPDILMVASDPDLGPYKAASPIMQHLRDEMDDDKKLEYWDAVISNKVVPGAVVSKVTPESVAAGSSHLELWVNPTSDYHGFIKMKFAVPTISDNGKDLKIAVIPDGDLTQLSSHLSEASLTDAPPGVIAIIGAHFITSDGELRPDVTTGDGPGIVTYRAATLPGITLWSFRTDGEGV